MQQAPKVSVLIPTYNYAHLLDETIQSVMAQTYTEFELIIVDNCSTDNTVEVVQKYLQDPRVSFYRNEKNLGLTGNWNRCLELAKGEYIKYLCADDKLHPQILEKYVPVMDADAGISVISCYRQDFDSTGLKKKVTHPPYINKIEGKKVIYDLVKHDNNFLGDPTRPMFRRANFEKVGNFKQLEFVTDWEMWVRQLTVGDCFVVPEILAYGRRHPGQQQVRCKKLSINHLELYQLYKAIQKGEYGFTYTEQREELDKMVKAKAAKCAFAMYKLIPKVHKEENRRLIKKFFWIAVAENVLVHPAVFDVYKQKLSDRKMVKQKLKHSV